MTTLKQRRREFTPELPDLLALIKSLSFTSSKHTLFPSKNHHDLQMRFPHLAKDTYLEGELGDERETGPLKVGIFFSGGQASGGHNVISGCFDALKKIDPRSELIGFLKGPSGILKGEYKQLDQNAIDPYRNQGGFDLIGSGRTKIETEEDLEKACLFCQKLKLDGLIVVGGDDSNTNAAIMAQYFLEKNCHTTVVGVPKTIDGDLSHPLIPVSFGFDTAARVYSEMIGNIARDALSAKKYTHFIKLMGRSASHIALECALYCKPNLTLISEEILSKKMTLKEVVNQIADLIVKRAKFGKQYSVILIPEGLIEFFHDIKALIEQINAYAAKEKSVQEADILPILTQEAKSSFLSLPETIRKQLLLDRDPHGNVNVSFIETERLLIHMVKEELTARKEYEGSLQSVSHFFGYEGRCSYPSYFDTHYCYALGFLAAALVRDKHTGYICSLTNLSEEVFAWKVGAVPLVSLMHLEMRKGKLKPVIAKALLDPLSPPNHFRKFLDQRTSWELEDAYEFPGPIQFSEDLDEEEKMPWSLRRN